MANRDCNGDFFTADGRRFYRCLWDGTLIESGTLLDDKCPHCQRMIAATELSHVEVRREIVTQFKHPSFGWVELEREEVPSQRTGADTP